MNPIVKKESCAGFSLVELALALLVAGMGVLAVFNMFPQGLDASRKSVDMSEMSVFAQWVLDSLEQQSVLVTASNVWDTQFESGGATAMAPKSHSMAYVTGTQPIVRAQGVASSDVQVYTMAPQFHQTLGVDSGYALAMFTYTLDVQNRGTAKKYARLEVWPGDKRAAVMQSIISGSKLRGSVVFYREFIPHYL
jgi:Tfp pilus assembly protein PilV